MNSKEQICYKVEALARKILTSYFCDSDVECLINTLAPDVLWLGGGKICGHAGVRPWPPLFEMPAR